MKKRTLFLGLLVLFPLISCNFSGIVRQPSNKSEIKLEVIDLPKDVKKDETAIFSLRTTPNNRCISGIGYWSIKNDEWVTLKLPEIVASDEGICQWDWIVTSEAKDGLAEFRAAIYQGVDSKELVPYQFCIEKCPELTPQNE